MEFAVIAAVKIFFVISGFYMAMILTGRYSDASIRVFYLSRFLRLYPTYALVLILSILGALLSSSGTLGPFIDLNKWRALLDHEGFLWTKIWLIAANVSMIGIDATLYGCIDLTTSSMWIYKGGCPGFIFNNLILIPQAWSISVEIAFYAIAPWVVRWSSPTLRLIILCGILSWLLLAIFGLYVNPWWRSTIPLEMPFFFAGVILYRAYAKQKAEGRLRFDILNCGKLDRFIGELSYPIYISHIMIMGLLINVGLNNLYLLIACVISFSALCVWLVVEPIDRLRWAIVDKNKLRVR